MVNYAVCRLAYLAVIAQKRILKFGKKIMFEHKLVLKVLSNIDLFS